MKLHLGETDLNKSMARIWGRELFILMERRGGEGIPLLTAGL